MKSSYYTGKGDNGTSSLFGSCDRFYKDDTIFNLLGTLDELNTWLGLCKISDDTKPNKNTINIALLLETEQQHLFIAQAQIAGADNMLQKTQVDELETIIATIAELIPPPTSFYLPGGCRLSTLLDIARTIARRCERIFIKANKRHPLTNYDITLSYLNRLSSLLYALVRYANHQHNIIEQAPTYGS